MWCSSSLASVITGIAMRMSGAWRLCAPVFGLVMGSGFAAIFGLYDTSQVVDAAWVGIPTGACGSFDLEFGSSSWALLPALLFAAVIAPCPR